MRRLLALCIAYLDHYAGRLAGGLGDWLDEEASNAKRMELYNAWADRKNRDCHTEVPS